MPRYLFDTDHLTLFQHGHAQVARRLALRTLGEVGISVVTVEETLRGRLATLARANDGAKRIAAYALLEQALLGLAQFPGIPFDQPAETYFQHLVKIRIGTQDRKMASTALASQSIVVTRNRRDFAQVRGLVLEDWSV